MRLSKPQVMLKFLLSKATLRRTFHSSIHSDHKYMYIYITYTLEVQRLFFELFFRRDYCFSKGLQSTIPGEYCFNGLWLPGYISIYIFIFRRLDYKDLQSLIRGSGTFLHCQNMRKRRSQYLFLLSTYYLHTRFKEPLAWHLASLADSHGFMVHHVVTHPEKDSIIPSGKKTIKPQL